MDLINKILKEKEQRLCSKKYLLNDYQHSKRIPGQLIATAANKHSRDYQGHFVYPDDASDIKAHPFFRDIPWDRLHLLKPPFVPKVKSWEDTKYFEEDEPISDVDESSTSDSDACKETPTPIPTPDPSTLAGAVGPATTKDQTDGHGGWNPAQSRGVGNIFKQDVTNAPAEAKGKAKQKREKKRPRDLVLRDKQVGKKVLELRKKGAFLGYTYRRPKGVVVDEEGERLGRQGVMKRGVMPSVS